MNCDSLQLPRLGPPVRNRGKGANDQLHFLPVLPSKRSKPEWQDNPPSFILSGHAAEEQTDTIDLAGELAGSQFECCFV